MSKIITGNDGLLPILGGYIYIKKEGKEFHIASVPSLAPGINLYRENVLENDDNFKDNEGNQFVISIWSSHVGIDWKLRLSAKNGDDEALAKQIEMEYQSNDY